MNIEATPDTIRATAAALGKARLLDDKLGNPDEARIAAWAEVIEPHKLGQQDLLQAVRQFYEGNLAGRTISPGELIHHARQVRQERALREPDSAREARQAALDTKVAERVAERINDMAGDAFTPEYDRPSERRGFNPLSVRCPHCRAGVGQACMNSAFKGAKRHQPHPSRIDAAHEKENAA